MKKKATDADASRVLQEASTLLLAMVHELRHRGMAIGLWPAVPLAKVDSSVGPNGLTLVITPLAASREDGLRMIELANEFTIRSGELLARLQELQRDARLAAAEEGCRARKAGRPRRRPQHGARS